LDILHIQNIYFLWVLENQAKQKMYSFHSDSYTSTNKFPRETENVPFLYFSNVYYRLKINECNFPELCSSYIGWIKKHVSKFKLHYFKNFSKLLTLLLHYVIFIPCKLYDCSLLTKYSHGIQNKIRSQKLQCRNDVFYRFSLGEKLSIGPPSSPQKSNNFNKRYFIPAFSFPLLDFLLLSEFVSAPDKPSL
jgi:hypothetical protein